METVLLVLRPESSVLHVKFPSHIINSLAPHNITFWGDFLVGKLELADFDNHAVCAKEGLPWTVCTSISELLVLPDMF